MGVRGAWKTIFLAYFDMYSIFGAGGPPPIIEVWGWQTTLVWHYCEWSICWIYLDCHLIIGSGSERCLKNHVLTYFDIYGIFGGGGPPPISEVWGWQTTLVWHYCEWSICWIYLDYQLVIGSGSESCLKNHVLAYCDRYGIFGAGGPPPISEVWGWQTTLVRHYCEWSICWIYLD